VTTVQQTALNSRAARREAAEERRKQWRLRWVELARVKHQEGLPVSQAVRCVFFDADQLIRETPQFRSEILRAMDEFVARLKTVVDKYTSLCK